ncbi:ATP-grasp peptide maturase system methyltransferase [Kutzneria sp. 744]|uniref:ATP-grasp peptide maturase system methyltransferase n=1 Tax=Kutzneria sp. (strain 744) TaxID=345341 RepID=UPI0003EEC11A|nr:ATP-grasp peptide maturase system methyltransferase [Kutzneria sp. 744]EWM15369.1 protein-L-isoaspartate(D-aspartate) O-methyltransferase [Kutzneria sp. 744]
MRAERESEARRLRGRLVDELVEEGLPLDAGWLAAFAAVPRHEFLPWLFEQRPDGAWSLLTSAEESWLRNVYRNRVAITQLDGDESLRQAALDGPVRGTPTCSSSEPSIMAIMLAALDIRDGDAVLEIGAGTGYNAALLCHRLGQDRVTTVDVDPAIAARAAEHLAAVGFHPTCVAADGAEGYPANAPYDRVLGTCSVSTIPLAWLAQTAPGGYIVTTLNRQLGAGLVKLTPDGDGRATGRVLASDGRFMPLRAHRGPRVSELADKVRGSQGSARTTELTPKRLLRPAGRFEFFAGLALPHVSAWSDTRSQTWLAHADGSWACYSRHSVSEGGPRRLWSIAEAAHEEWEALGQPPRERFGLTVTPGGQEFWLDSPDSPHRWPLD